jgi:hypothetical protein
MSNLGTIAVNYPEAYGGNTSLPGTLQAAANYPEFTQGTGFYYIQGNLCAIRLGGFDAIPDLLPYAGKNTSDGTPSQPSFQMAAGPMFYRFRWAVAAGTPTISIAVKQASNTSPRPTMVIKANAAIGVSSDIVLTAGSGSGWVTLGPQSVSISSPGGLWIELHNNLPGWATCLWDNLVTTP